MAAAADAPGSPALPPRLVQALASLRATRAATLSALGLPQLQEWDVVPGGSGGGAGGGWYIQCRCGCQRGGMAQRWKATLNHGRKEPYYALHKPKEHFESQKHVNKLRALAEHEGCLGEPSPRRAGRRARTACDADLPERAQSEAKVSARIVRALPRHRHRHCRHHHRHCLGRHRLPLPCGGPDGAPIVTAVWCPTIVSQPPRHTMVGPGTRWRIVTSVARAAAHEPSRRLLQRAATYAEAAEVESSELPNDVSPHPTPPHLHLHRRRPSLPPPSPRASRAHRRPPPSTSQPSDASTAFRSAVRDSRRRARSAGRGCRGGPNAFVVAVVRSV